MNTARAEGNPEQDEYGLDHFSSSYDENKNKLATKTAGLNKQHDISVTSLRGSMNRSQ